MRVSSLVGVALAALVSSAVSANAQQRVQVGVLECHGGPNVGMVVTSVTQLNCVFRSEGRRPEPYIAKVSRFGIDLGITEQTGLAWAVHAPTFRIGRGDLSGDYGGVGGNASIGIGGGGNLLIGGSANSYALQPLSLQGQTGFNAAGGLVGLELRPGGLTPRKHKRHRRHH
ncbi:MAG: DUF992 domain-containing protein [Rhizobiales bacterium]|nr:DUF992 domain-containing protein [Hyphomicrobiales bacterium]